MSKPNFFTIRVYGLLIDNEALLLSRENIYGSIFTKLPGGGLEVGEGIRDCLKREFQEEAQLKVKVLEHFYTTEDYILSAFNPQAQVLSIYYKVSCDDLSPLAKLPESDFSKHGDQKLFWRKLRDLKADDLDLALDKIVVEKLLGGK